MFKDRVLFIDGEALVIDKPAGLPVDRPRDRAESLEDLLDQLTFGFQRLPVPVHRLDRDTSGCLLLARNPKALKRFAQAFEAGAVAKRYLAILDGEPAQDSGTIDLPLAKVSTREQGWRMVGDPRGKPSITRYKVMERKGGRSLVAFYPETGRTHQIRVHAAEGLGAPVMGDPVYGRGGPAMMLHAIELTLPREGKDDIHATAPLPVRFHNAGFGAGFGHG
ncbi:MAG: RNA pseudouridine synthase [Sphingomonas sp.]|uniref:RluA family pseudouridine synthase n=1 Tax=unclassified Sphingomonas TaxID=196159 RepID=UPI0024546795|nr:MULTISPECIES: RNA pseudouridine synthase [unclassified Sphingomonas]MBQ1500107.1 RNA pseudouridine synthase [Sphingomonas sp.]MDH4745336.1 RNA pseudouridine synthase [Sphingomonas sp. CBMAI 2297]